MCYYRYYYFGGCQHNKTALYEWCDIALSRHAQADNTPAISPRQQPHSRAQSATRAPSNGSSDSNATTTQEQYSMAGQKTSAAASTSSSPHTTTSSTGLSIGSTASTELVPDHSSLQQQQPAQRRHSAASIHDMAGFSGWFRGGHAKPSQATSSVTTAGEINHDITRRGRDSAYREQTDESSNMPDRYVFSQIHTIKAGVAEAETSSTAGASDMDGVKVLLPSTSADRETSSEILRHIAGSCRSNFINQHIGTDEGQAPSFATDLTIGSWREQPGKAIETHDALESEVDKLKRELAELKAREEQREAEQNRRNTDKEEFPPLRSTRSRLPQGQPSTPESAAARLQRQHELAQQTVQPQSGMNTLKNVQAPALHSPHDFPDLSQGKANRRRDTDHDTRKPSYAAMAVTGVMDALDRQYPDPQRKNGSDITSGTAFQSSFNTRSDVSTAGTSVDGADHANVDADLGDDSVIITPSNADATQSETTATIRGSPASPGKSAPRFAQPTKAFARRADETLRKEPQSPTTKVTPDASPNKSTRTLKQQQQKRKSLPGGWMNNPGTSSSDSPPTKDNTLVKGDSGKKASSFMAPTKATTRREIATLGQETTKRTSPRVQKTLPRINTAVMPTKIPTGTDSIIVDPAQPQVSLEQFPTDRVEIPSLSDAAHDVTSITTSTRHVLQAPMPRRSTVSSPLGDIISAKAMAAGLPAVPNTTTKRRGSHGHLLLPIKAKLDKYGLLNENRSPSGWSDGPALESPPMGLTTVREAAPETPPSQVADPATAPQEPRPKFLPPHLARKLNRSSESESVVSAVSSTSQVKAPAEVVILTSTPSTIGQASQTPSLRATAAEFKPMLQPGTYEKELDEYSKSGVLDSKSQREWQSLSWEDKQAIMRVRELRDRTRAFSATMPGASPVRGSPRFANKQQQFGPTGLYTNPFGSPLRPVQPGQKLRPEIDPNTGALHWTMEDLEGHKAPVNFGRAAPPSFESPSSPPSISPTSDDTSPRHSIGGTPRGWTIGSLASRNEYGWAGGDGKEIKFQGWGPDAERDPNNAVNFSFQGRTAGMGVGPRMVGGSEDDGTQPLAPRSRRQWAETLELPAPCGKVEITDAYEVPFVPQQFSGGMWDAANAAAFCFDCRGPDVVAV